MNMLHTIVNCYTNTVFTVYSGDIKILFIYLNILMMLKKYQFNDFHSMPLQNLERCRTDELRLGPFSIRHSVASLDGVEK